MNEFKIKIKTGKYPSSLVIFGFIFFLATCIFASLSSFAAANDAASQAQLKSLITELASECPDSKCDWENRRIYFSDKSWRQYSSYYDQLRKRIHVQKVKVWSKMHGKCPTKVRASIIEQEGFSANKLNEIQYSSTRKMAYIDGETICAREHLDLEVSAFSDPKNASGRFVINAWDFKFPDALDESCSKAD